MVRRDDATARSGSPGRQRPGLKPPALRRRRLSPRLRLGRINGRDQRGARLVFREALTRAVRLDEVRVRCGYSLVTAQPTASAGSNNHRHRHPGRAPGRVATRLVLLPRIASATKPLSNMRGSFRRNPPGASGNHLPIRRPHTAHARPDLGHSGIEVCICEVAGVARHPPNGSRLKSTAAPGARPFVLAKRSRVQADELHPSPPGRARAHGNVRSIRVFEHDLLPALAWAVERRYANVCQSKAGRNT
jgi:hypothetical protein